MHRRFHQPDLIAPFTSLQTGRRSGISMYEIFCAPRRFFNPSYFRDLKPPFGYRGFFFILMRYPDTHFVSI
jgi:hypothetical protein